MKLYPTQAGQEKYRVSFLGTIALVGAVLIYLYSTTWNPETINSFFTMFLILISGVVLSSIMVGIQFVPFSFRSIVQDMLVTAGAFFSIYVVNSVVPLSVPDIGVNPLGNTGFVMLSGVAEEWFFRMFLCCWIYKFTRSVLIAVPISSFAWAVFHLSRYGANLNIIGLVFLVGLPLGYLTLLFRSADGCTFGHMIVNALTGGG